MIQNIKQSIIDDEQEYLLRTYNRYKIVLSRGEGVYLFDKENNKYLDFLSGISVCNLGHCNKQLNRVIKEQLDKLIHTSNLYYTENQIELAKRISKISFKGKTFFANSGTEANEAAIKFIRFRSSNIKKGKTNIISLKGSFHGRTMGSLSITGQEKHQSGFEPILKNIHFAAPNDIKSLQSLFNDNTAGIIVETIQGERGVYPLSAEFLLEARRLCDKYNALLILDEVQTGLGRAGSILSYKDTNIVPDGFTLAKSLANGLPIGVFHISDKYKDIDLSGKHASTFGGNPLVCSAAIEVINILENGLLDKAKQSSKYLFSKLYSLKDEFGIISEIRGRGLMLAMQTKGYASTILSLCHKEGLLVNSIGEDIVRFLPPLIITQKDIDLFYEKMKTVLSKIKV